jgi:hypothetical protein
MMHRTKKLMAALAVSALSVGGFTGLDVAFQGATAQTTRNAPNAWSAGHLTAELFEGVHTVGSQDDCSPPVGGTMHDGECKCGKGLEDYDGVCFAGGGQR